MAMALIGNISMYYELYGNGKTLILISGFGADHTSWYGMVNILKYNYQILLVDTRGVGETAVGNECISIDLLSGDIVKLCHSLGIEQAHFIGHSMGGCIVQNIAYKYKNIVLSSVIMNSCMIADTSYKYFLDAYYELIKLNTSKATLIKLMISWTFSPKFLDNPKNYETIIDNLLSKKSYGNIEGFMPRYDALFSFDSTSWAEQINQPTLVIAGGRDLILSCFLSEKMYQKIPNSIYHCFPECGHVPHVEYLLETVKIISKFIETKVI